MSELTQRVLLALALAPLFIIVLWYGDLYFYGLMAFIAGVTVLEILQMFKSKGYKINVGFGMIFFAWAFASPWLEYFWEIGSALMLIYIASETLNPPHDRVKGSVATLFGPFYACWGLLSLTEIRGALGDDSLGFALTLILILMIWGNDVFAYFGGKTFGKHKMAPDISPKKTWEGFGSGFLGSLLVLIGGWYFTQDVIDLTLLSMLPMVILVGVFGPVGDLAASKIKRYTGCKDSGNILPGHGGFFDRFDSLILVSPAVYVYFSFLNLL